jgi:hypothetical protein
VVVGGASSIGPTHGKSIMDISGQYATIVAVAVEVVSFLSSLIPE